MCVILSKNLLQRTIDGGRRIDLMGLQNTFGEGFFTTRLEHVVSWGRKYSLWPMPFGTACCAIEFMGVVSSRFDISRFGAELVRFSPRQADLLMVMGTITYKQAPILKRIWEQMCEPKWCIAMGACASSGGFYDNYSTLQGIDEVIPVDVYIPGCPPRPEQVMHAIVKLQEKIAGEGKSFSTPPPVIDIAPKSNAA